MGYEPVKADELPCFEHLRVKAGENVGFVACTEMVLYRLPMSIYQDLMMELHYHAPREEQEKIKVQQEQLLAQRDSNGKSLVSIEGDGMSFSTNQKNTVPVFE
jgi:hypothetical protein